MREETKVNESERRKERKKERIRARDNVLKIVAKERIMAI